MAQITSEWLTAEYKARFWAQVEKAADGCWPWTGNRTPTGYGRFCGRRGYVLAHRYAYTVTHGTLPNGREIHHACEHPWCVRPDHLQAVTRREHSVELTPHNFTAINAAKTHCAHGHEFTPENIYHAPGEPGARHCLTCRRERTRQYAKRRERKLTARGLKVRAAKPPRGGFRLSISCGTCQGTASLAARSLEKARAEAKEAGWESTRGRGWMCPDCLGGRQ